MKVKLITCERVGGGTFTLYWTDSYTDPFEPDSNVPPDGQVIEIERAIFFDVSSQTPLLTVSSSKRKMWFRRNLRIISLNPSRLTSLRCLIAREAPSATIPLRENPSGKPNALSYSIFDLHAFCERVKAPPPPPTMHKDKACLYFSAREPNWEITENDAGDEPDEQTFLAKWNIDQWSPISATTALIDTACTLPVVRLNSSPEKDFPSLPGPLDLPLENLNTKISETEIRAVWPGRNGLTGAQKEFPAVLQIVQAPRGRSIFGIPSPQRAINGTPQAREPGYVAVKAGDLRILGEPLNGDEEKTTLQLSVAAFCRWWQDAVGALATESGLRFRAWLVPDAASEDKKVSFRYIHSRSGKGPVRRESFLGAQGLGGTLVFPDLETAERQPLALPATFKIVDPGEDGCAVGITFDKIGAGGIAAQVVRAGSLDLVFGGESASSPGALRARMVPLHPGGSLAWNSSDGPSHTLELEVASSIDLPLLAVRPGGQDVADIAAVKSSVWEVFGVNRQPPLTISNSAKLPNTAQFLLRVSDDPRYRIQTLDGAQPQTSTVIVIDPEPFLVARAEVPLVEDPDEADSSGIIAEWTGTGPEAGYWRIRHSKPASLTLPPQAVGEASEKDKLAGRDIDEDQLAGFRLGCTAELSLRTSYASQRFVEPLWNLRRVLGYAGQRAPGAGLESASFEMLYGLAVRLTTPYLRLAEIFALAGETPLRAPKKLMWPGTSAQDAEYEKALDAWKSDAGEIRSRLALLEPWHPAQPEGLRVSDPKELKFRLRVEKAAGAGQLPRGALLKYPLDAGKPPSPEASLYFAPEGLPPIPPSTDPPNGLPGGVTWPFESLNILNEFLRESAASSSGEISNLYFSALGGWANQMARFNRDKTIFESRVRMGRTHYQTLERIGRIGAFWNRAKHVIVFERTVVPTRQFASDQNPHEGRPILRKVREYVQILQPERRYPEEGSGGAPMDTGFVNACIFKSTIIPVSSAWGEDVGTVGWKVPLWNPSADPVVYPKPQIVLEMASAPSSSAGAVFSPFRNPGQLFFFTDTTTETDARTDLWPSTATVDYPDAPEPAVPDWDALDPSAPDTKLPDAPRSDSGWGRFTFDLDSSNVPVNVQSGRSAAETLEAVVLNVSMARSAAQSVATGPAAQARDAIRNLEKSAQALAKDAQAPTKQWLVQKLTDIKAAQLDSIAGALKARREALETAIDERVKATLTSATARVENAYKAMLEKIRDAQGKALEIEDAINHFEAWLPSLAFDAAGLGAMFSRKVDEAIAVLERPLVNIETLAATALAQIDELERQVQRLAPFPNPPPNPLPAELDDFLGRLAKLNSDFAGVDLSKRLPLVGDITAIFQPLRAKLANLVALLPTTLTVPDFSAIRRVIAEVRDAVAAARNAIHGKITELRDELGAQLQSAGQTAAGWLDARRKGLLDELKNLRAKVGDAGFDAALTRAKAAVDTALRDARQNAAQWAAGIQASLAGIDTEFKNIKSDVLTRLTKTGADVRAIAEEWFDDVVRKAGNDVTTLRETILDELRSEIGEIGDDLALEAAKAGNVYQNASRALRTGRAFAESLKTEGLAFNRERVALYLTQGAKALGMTPSAARLKEFGQSLEALGLRVPTNQLLDRIVPDFKLPGLENLSAGKMLSDVGIRLEDLLPDFSAKDLLPQWITVTHGVDKQNLRAFAKAHVDAPLDGNYTLFSECSVRVDIVSPKIIADVDMQVDASGAVAKSGAARMAATWILSVGGVELVRFNDTAVTFKDGRMGFEIAPAKVELAGVLKVLTDLTRTLGYSSGGFSVGLPTVGGIPVGVRATLELPELAVAAGAFSMRGLQLGSFFDIRALDDNLKFDFSLATGFHLARKERPFTIQLFMLGGGGWIDASVRYFPARRQSELDVSIGIAARAGLDINLGVAKGSASVSFGAYVEYHRSLGGPGGQMVVAVFVLIEGELDILGIVSVYLALRLDIFYLKSPAGSRMFGRGTVTLRIKICWCFTLKVNKSVDFTLGNMANTAPAAPLDATAADPYDAAAKHYVDYVE